MSDTSSQRVYTPANDWYSGNGANLDAIRNQGVQGSSPGTVKPSAPTSGEKGLAYASAGISAIGSIATAFLTIGAFESKLKADTEYRKANMDNVLTSYEYEANKNKEDVAMLKDTYANKITERSIKGMEDLATAKTMGAETGASGTVRDEANADTKAKEMMDVAIINQNKNNAIRGVLSKSDKARVEASNKFKEFASGTTSVSANSILAAMGGFSDTLGSLLVSMPESVSSQMFSFDNGGQAPSINNSRYA